MKQQAKARITGIGSYLPSRIMTNQEFEKLVDTTDEWIVSRTGIKERRIAAPEELTSDMGEAAARKAIENAGISTDDIDLVVFTTMTPDSISSNTGALLQNRLGLRNVGSMDVQAACSGFIYGLSMVKAYIESGMYNTILLVASERMSTYVDFNDRSTCILFGDGAAAAVVSNKGTGLAIDEVCLGSDGSLSEIVCVPGGGVKHPPSAESVARGLHFFKMEGKEVFKHAVRRMAAAAKECLEAAGIQEDQVSWVVPHQANLRIIDAIAKNLSIADQKIYKTVQKYGNTSASSIAIALDELTQEHKIEKGERLLLIAFGAGLTWGASLLTKMEGA